MAVQQVFDPTDAVDCPEFTNNSDPGDTTMLQYVMRDKGLSSTYGFLISDSADHQLYRADGVNWTLSREYTLKDEQGTELFRLKQKLLSISPTYTISRDGDHCATIRKSWKNYKIDTPSQPQIIVDQSLGGVNLTFKRDGKLIAQARKKPVSLSENCTVEVETPEDTEMILASMVAIYDMSR